MTSGGIWSPWSCDFGGITLGRLRGWRPGYNNIPHVNKSMEVKQGATHGYEMKGAAKFTVTPEGAKP